jgi:UDP-N-acetylmuramoyl-L-alanyl-D-glutamate--2,6-diaminopimelate ligase
MKLETIALSTSARLVQNARRAVDITGITCDSRNVRLGDLFAALPGTKANGAEFAKQAAQRGAAAILCEREEPLTELPQLVCTDARLALAKAARAFYGHADLRMRLGAVTGTNGKSTTAYLVRHILKACSRKCGMLGTIEYDLGSEVLEAPLTTPESLDLHRFLRTMADAGCDSAVMETSSHSLCQQRVAGIHFDAAVFTNLTQDHLDFHRTMDEYRDAKAILFRELLPDANAILNLDDPTADYYARCTQARVLGFTVRGKTGAVLSASIKQMTIQGTSFDLSSPWGEREVMLKLAGVHNVQNALGALAAAMSMGAEFDQSISALESFAGVPGRLESVELPRESSGARKQNFRVFVDYAHTEDALVNVMKALRELRPSRLIAVFGCGGDRDRTKRPKMGRAVEEMADLGVITSDNPRTEDPHAIIGDICAGLRKQSKFIVEPDRARAIVLAIREARAGDVVLIAGKGHETYQIFGKEKRHFSDVEEAAKALRQRFE